MKQTIQLSDNEKTKNDLEEQDDWKFLNIKKDFLYAAASRNYKEKSDGTIKDSEVERAKLANEASRCSKCNARISAP